MEEYVHIGKAKSPFGISGELRLHIESPYLEDLLQAPVLFVEISGRQVPFFIENVRAGKDLLIKLEDVRTREDAARLTSKPIFLRTSDLIPEDERQTETSDQLEYEKYTGFELIDVNAGRIGFIDAVLEYPQQEMALVSYKEKEILIPLAEAFIQSIDEKKEIITVDLPEGLLEL